MQPKSVKKFVKWCLTHESFKKFSDTGIQDVSTSISITVKFEEMTDDDEGEDDESDKHLEARDRRYSCLKFLDARSKINARVSR